MLPFKGKKESRPDLEIFAFYDSKAKTYGNPTFAINKDDLIRSIINMFGEPEQQEKNTLYLNSEDYSVFKIGSYSKVEGAIQTQHQEHVVNLHDLKALVPVHRKYPKADIPYPDLAVYQKTQDTGIVPT